MNDISIKREPTDGWKEISIPYDYVSKGYYHVEKDVLDDAFAFRWTLEDDKTTVKSNDKKYPVIEDYKGDTEIWVAKERGKFLGLLQIQFQEWNRSVRLWDFFVENGHRRTGIGHRLMEKAKERALALGARRIILETQSCNLPAINFYRKEGFELVGFDLTHYHNDDIERKEVRFEMAFHLEK